MCSAQSRRVIVVPEEAADRDDASLALPRDGAARHRALLAAGARRAPPALAQQARRTHARHLRRLASQRRVARRLAAQLCQMRAVRTYVGSVCARPASAIQKGIDGPHSVMIAMYQGNVTVVFM